MGTDINHSLGLATICHTCHILNYHFGKISWDGWGHIGAAHSRDQFWEIFIYPCSSCVQIIRAWGGLEILKNGQKSEKIAKIWGQGRVTCLGWTDMALGRIPSCSEGKRTLGPAENRSPDIQNGWEWNGGAGGEGDDVASVKWNWEHLWEKWG